jgi:hypothetical protein
MILLFLTDTASEFFCIFLNYWKFLPFSSSFSLMNLSVVFGQALLGVVTTRTEGERVETWSTADYLAHALSV